MLDPVFGCNLFLFLLDGHNRICFFFSMFGSESGSEMLLFHAQKVIV